MRSTNERYLNSFSCVHLRIDIDAYRRYRLYRRYRRKIWILNCEMSKRKNMEDSVFIIMVFNDVN